MATDSNYERLTGQESPASTRYVPQHGLARYRTALQTLLPLRIHVPPAMGPTPTLPLDNVGFFSYITFHWLSYLLWTTYRTCLSDSNLPDSDSSDINGQRLSQLWQDSSIQSGQLKTSMCAIAWRFVRTRVLIAAVLQIISIMVAIISPWAIIDYLLTIEEPSWWDRVLGALILMGIEMLAVLLKAWSTSISSRTAVRLRSAFLAIAYKKMLRLADPGPIGYSPQKLLLDATSIHSAVLYSHHVITSPLVLAACIALMTPGYKIALFIVSAFLITLLLLWVLVNLSGFLSSRVVILSIQRHARLQELIDNFTLVKMTVCEKIFSHNIAGLHCRELSYLVKSFFCDSVSQSVLQAVPLIAAMLLLCKIDKISLLNNTLVIILLFTHIKDTLFRFWIGLRTMTTAVYALNELKELLILEDGESFQGREKPIAKDTAVSITNASFTRRNKAMPITTNRLSSKKSLDFAMIATPELVDISMQITKGTLIGLVGRGSSALLLAILGQLRTTRGVLMRDGSCAYVNGDKPWLITNADVRDNVVMPGEKFNQKKYYETLNNCCLHKDLPHGDRTVIAKVALSRSQAQRIALARVFYADRDIYLLDKPLSAVGAEESIETFTRSILNCLKNRTVIIATQNIQFLNRCNEIFVLEDGKIVEHGTHEELLAEQQKYASLVKQHIRSTSLFLEAEGVALEADGSKDSLVESATVKPLYIAGGWFTVTILALLLSVAILFTCLVLLVINVTLTSRDTTLFLWFKNVGYASLVGLAAILGGLIWRVLFTKTGKRVSERAHRDWLNKLVKAPIAMLANTTAKQDVLQCFSLHTQLISCTFPMAVGQFIENLIMLVGCAALLLFKTPWSLVPLALFYAVSVVLITIYRGSVLQISEMEVSKQRLLREFIEMTVRGRVTIQSLGRHKEFISRFIKLCDSHASCVFLLEAASRWISVRIQLLAVLFVGGVLFAESDSPKKDGGYLFVVLIAAWQIGGYTRRTVRSAVESAAGINIMQRSNCVIQNLATEECVQDTQLDVNDGSVMFGDVHTKMSLKGVSFDIGAGQSIGVLGSSRNAVIAALYKLVPVTQGDIKVGNVDIALIPHNFYRQNLSLIPRLAPMFSFNVRQFLDPHKLHTDTKMRECLSSVGLGSMIIRLDLRLPLDSSLNVRELLWLARAVLAQPKVLVLEETSHVTAGQVREHIPGCTVLIVAGQLSSSALSKCDKALVITQGKVSEFGETRQLYRRNESVVSRMLAESTGSLFETEL